MFSDMLNNAVADGLVVIKSVHDLLPARVRKVTEAWPEEVLVITIVLVILLNIAFFLTNVKVRPPKRPPSRVPRPASTPALVRRRARRPSTQPDVPSRRERPARDLSQFHEMKKRNRAPASAKTTVEVALVSASPAKSHAAEQDAPASAASPQKPKANPKAKAPAKPKPKAKAKPSASKTDPAAEKKFAEECGRWMHSLPAGPKAKLLKSLKTAGDDDAKRIAAYRASAVADVTKTRAVRKEKLLAAVAALE